MAAQEPAQEPAQARGPWPPRNHVLAHVRAHVWGMRRLHAPDSCGMCGLARALLPLPRALPRWRTWHAQSRRAGAGLRRALQIIVAKTGISSAHVT